MVTELAEPFAMSLPAVSRHIRVLGTGSSGRCGKSMAESTLALDPAPLRTAEAWLSHYRPFWEEAAGGPGSLCRK